MLTKVIYTQKLVLQHDNPLLRNTHNNCTINNSFARNCFNNSVSEKTVKLNLS